MVTLEDVVMMFGESGNIIVVTTSGGMVELRWDQTQKKWPGRFSRNKHGGSGLDCIAW